MGSRGQPLGAGSADGLVFRSFINILHKLICSRLAVSATLIILRVYACGLIVERFEGAPNFSKQWPVLYFGLITVAMQLTQRIKYGQCL